ncbi:MAG: hypothetical protein AAGG01_17990 [Planctomycetota bacterium]
MWGTDEERQWLPDRDHSELSYEPSSTPWRPWEIAITVVLMILAALYGYFGSF